MSYQKNVFSSRMNAELGEKKTSDLLDHHADDLLIFYEQQREGEST